VTRGPARALLAAACLALGCVADPVLYPNGTYLERGETQADQDVEECATLAKEHKASPAPGGEVASNTVEDAAVGGAAGAVGGAVAGNPGTGAAAGAAAGATGGLIRALFHARREPAPAYRAFVERCLEERGYEVVGWD